MMRGSGRVARALRWRARLVTDLFGTPQRKHQARARWAAIGDRITWSIHTRRARRGRGDRRTILIGLVEHLGDIVATEPVARFVRERNPDGYVVWAVRPAYRELLDHNPHIDAVLPVSCLTEWIHFVDRRQPFDQVIDLHVRGRFCPVCNTKLEKATGDAGIDLTNYYRHGNLLEVACRSAGLPVLDEGPRVNVPAEVARRVDALALPPRFAVAHCTSSQDVRDWEAAKWRPLVERIVDEHGLSVVEVGLEPLIGAPAPAGYTNLCGRLSILETAEVIRRAAAFVGIDSGPAHLANAVGTPGVILLGHYRSYARYMPYSGGYASGANADVIQWDGPAAAIPVERVLEGLATRLGASRVVPAVTTP